MKKFIKLLFIGLLVAIFSVSVISCGEEEKDPVITTVEIAGAKDLKVGNEIKLTTTVDLAGATYEIEWASDNDKVLTVDKDGNVVAVGVGTANVTATVKGTEVKKTVKIIVEERPAVEVFGANNVKVGANFRLNAVVNNGAPADIEWKSSDEKVLVVDANGNVEVFSAGSAVVTATVKGTDFSSNYTINVVPEYNTFNDYLAVSPSNWNELTYQDYNDTNIMNYLASSFFSFDYKFNGDKKDANSIVDGQFVINYEAATKLEDVTKEYAGNAKYSVPADATDYYAYKITLREDLMWNDGTPIKAEDFVYTMKEQLNPLFQNYRADSFYVGATIINDAENYVKQGQSIWVDGDNKKYSVADLVKGADGVYTQPDGGEVLFCLNEPLSYLDGDTVADYSGYLEKASYDALVALADENGRVKVTDETIALVTKMIDTDDWGHETPDYVPSYWKYFYSYPALDFEEVGIFAPSDYELVIVLDKQLDLVDKEGNLTYKAAYNMASLPLVKKDLYEACKIAPVEGNDLWTTNYNTSLDTTASWGPYMLTAFQNDMSYKLTKNYNWYGFSSGEYDDFYQTDAIHVDIVKEWNTAWLLFQAGKLDGIGIDVSIADDYKTSDRAYFTPSDFVSSLQLQSSVESLKGRETEGVNKSILANIKFRKALSLSVDRADFAKKTTTSSLAGFGLFNSMHYYDVAHGGVYRNEDIAKETLCRVYSVNVDDYATLDDAYEAITGYNLELARTLITEAYNEELAAGNIKATDKVLLTFGSGAINEVVTRRYEYLADAWKLACVGTPLENRLELEIKDFQAAWANDFRAGAYDVCMGGWSGAAWDPGYFLLAYLTPAYMYSTAWKTNEVTMEFTMKGAGENGADITDTLTLLQWYDCLNGAAGAKYNFGQGALEEAKRLTLIAALEEQVLSVYYSVPLYNDYSASLIAHKVDYITYVYNTFMGYGGMKYMTYNYSDSAWAQHLANNNNKLDYK